jgi:hypothetical protein
MRERETFSSSVNGFVPVFVGLVGLLLWAESMGRSAMILAVCMSVTGFLAYIAIAEVPTKPGQPRQSILQRFLAVTLGGGGEVVLLDRGSSAQTQMYSSDPLSDLVEKFRWEMTDARDSLLMLSQMLRRIRKTDPRAEQVAKDAHSLGLMKCVLVFSQNVPVDDPRIPICADIVNEMLAKKTVRKTVCSDESQLRDMVDCLLVVLKDAVSPPRVQNQDEGDNDGDAVDEEGKKLLMPAPKKIPNECFNSYGYKLIMAVGMLGMDNREAQSTLGDRGAFGIVLGAMQTYGPLSEDVVKWGCWSLIHLTFDHPPNKRECHQRGGLTLVIDALKQHSKSAAVFEQALGIIISILIPDSQTKMNQSQARQAALAHNIFDVLQKSQKEFKENEHIQAMINQILQILITDWS